MFGTPATATPAQPAHPAASANPITGPSPAAPAAQLGRHDGGRPQTGATSQTEFVTGAYENSGDPTIDRLLQLEQALKRFGRGY